MPTQLQLRRGTTNQHSTFTGVVGEVTINTTKKTAVVHDGSTAGGLELLRADMSNVFASATPTITSLNTSGDVSVGGNLTVTGTTTFNGGTITMGDADTDNVVFGADVNSNILPNTDNTYALGSSSKKWSDVRSVLLTTTSDATIGGDVAINGGDLTTSQTTFNLLNTTATTLNVGGAATSLNLGANSGTTTVNNNLTVTGDLTVNGTTTTVNSTTLTVDDKNIELASVATPTDITADGAGITIKGATDKTFNWIDATDAFTSSEHLALASGKNLYLNGSTSGTTTLTPSATASGTLTLPAATDTLVGKATTDTLTNKSVSLTTNTITGTLAEFNTALSDDNFVSLTGSETLTNKTLTTPVISSISNSGTITIPTGTDTLVGRATTDTLTNKTLTSPVISTITNTGTLTLPTSTDTLVGRATTDTLTNKSISLTTNTITGTLAEFNTALSGDDFVSLTGSETLTNKTLTSPVISTITNTGTLTLPTSTDTLVGRATTDTLTNKTLTSPKIGTSVLDTNGNSLLLLTATASAVNQLTLANAATTNSPTLSATGSDTNIGIAITPKGTGTILVGNSIVPSADSTMDLGATGAKFRDLFLSGSSIIMGTTKIKMHADGYLQFNTNSGAGYPDGSLVSVATATNGIAATNGTAAAFAIALGG